MAIKDAICLVFFSFVSAQQLKNACWIDLIADKSKLFFIGAISDEDAHEVHIIALQSSIYAIEACRLVDAE